jgi:enoyl-[acyl-carrier-protein] reductase (NADH)
MAGGDEGSLDMAGAANMETVEPEVIADTVAWLVSDTGKHISGVALPVDDGYVNKR